MKDILKSVFLVFLGLLLIVGVFALESAICMWLWNWVIVELFGAKTISFSIAIGITLALDFIGGFFKQQ